MQYYPHKTASRAVVESIDNANNFQVGTAKSFGVQNRDFDIFHPYGFESLPPSGSLATLFPVLDSPENLFGMVYHPNLRYKELESGEVIFWNPLTKTKIIQKANGDTILDCKNDLTLTVTNNVNLTCNGTVTINAPTTNINGNVTVTGNFTVTGQAILAGIGFNTHVHTGVQPGPSNTGGPSNA